MDYSFERVGMSLLTQSPFLLACLLGCGLSLLFLRRSKGAGLFALAGSALFFLTRIGASLASEWIISMQFQGERRGQTISNYFLALNVSNSLLSALALALLMLAIHAGCKARGGRIPREGEERGASRRPRVQ